MALALKNSREYSGQEILVERPDGSRVTALAHASPFFDELGRLLGAVNILVDISDRKRAEQAQAMLAAIVASSEDAIVSKTLDGRILTWNAGAERLFGYSAIEAVGSLITLIIPPEMWDEESEILSRLTRGQRIEHYETIRMNKQGQRLNISLTISPIRDSTGRVVAASKVARNITARKHAEEDLRQTQQRFTRFMQHLPGLAWIKDRQGRYVFVNQTAAQALGGPESELMG